MDVGWIYVIFKLATLDQLDDVRNLGYSILVWLIPKCFSGITIQISIKSYVL